MDSFLCDFFLTRAGLRNKLELELAWIWETVAGKLSMQPRHRGVITTDWINKITSRTGPNLIFRARRFLRKAGKFVTVSSLIQALKAIHKVRIIKIITDDVNHYVSKPDQMRHQPLLRDLLKNYDRIDSLVIRLASEQTWYYLAASLSMIDRLSKVITTRMIDTIAKTFKSYLDQVKEFLRQIGDDTYGYEFAFCCGQLGYEDTAGNIEKLLPSKPQLVQQYPEDPMQKWMTYQFFNKRMKLYDNLLITLVRHEKNNVPGWELLANALKTYYPDRLQPEDIKAYNVYTNTYEIVEKLFKDYRDWEDSTADRLAACLDQIGLSDIANQIRTD